MGISLNIPKEKLDHSSPTKTVRYIIENMMHLIGAETNSMLKEKYGIDSIYQCASNITNGGVKLENIYSITLVFILNDKGSFKILQDALNLLELEHSSRAFKLKRDDTFEVLKSDYKHVMQLK
jgi:hypothetical protein